MQQQRVAGMKSRAVDTYRHVTGTCSDVLETCVVSFIPMEQTEQILLVVSECQNYTARKNSHSRVSMTIYGNKRRRLYEKNCLRPEDCFGTSTWPPFHCLGTPIWPPWRHVGACCTAAHTKVHSCNVSSSWYSLWSTTSWTSSCYMQHCEDKLTPKKEPLH